MVWGCACEGPGVLPDAAVPQVAVGSGGFWVYRVSGSGTRQGPVGPRSKGSLETLNPSAVGVPESGVLWCVLVLVWGTRMLWRAVAGAIGSLSSVCQGLSRPAWFVDLVWVWLWPGGLLCGCGSGGILGSCWGSVWEWFGGGTGAVRVVVLGQFGRGFWVPLWPGSRFGSTSVPSGVVWLSGVGACQVRAWGALLVVRLGAGGLGWSGVFILGIFPGFVGVGWYCR